MDFLNSNPFSAATLAALFAALTFVAIINFYGRKKSGKRKMYHPIAATRLKQIIHFKKLNHCMTELSKKHSTFRVLGLFRSEIYTTDPANVEYILKTNFSNYGKGWYHYETLTDLLGDGMFTVDGENWKKQRKIASYQFSTKILKDFSTSVFKFKAVELCQIVSEAETNGTDLNMTDLFMKSTLETVLKIILGIEMDDMFETAEEATILLNALDKVNDLTVHRYLDIFWKIKRFFNIGSEAVLRSNIKLVDEFVYRVIKRKTSEIHSKCDEDSSVDKGALLSKLIALGDGDMKYIRDMVLTFIIAGKDTTSVTMSWFLYMLCKHPNIQEKVAQEVRQAMIISGSEKNPNVEELVTSLTEEAINKMQYLLATLTETLRLYPAIPLDSKFCFSDDTFPDGFSIKKGDNVTYMPYAMGRMKFIWGDDAEEFKPERWIDKNGLFRPESPFKLTAFQAGPRICLGKEFAYRQMIIFMSVLLGNYKFKMSEEGKEVNYKTTISLLIDGGLHLRAHKRQWTSLPTQ